LEKVYQFGGKFQENIREGAFEGEGKITLLATLHLQVNAGEHFEESKITS